MQHIICGAQLKLKYYKAIVLDASNRKEEITQINNLKSHF